MIYQNLKKELSSGTDAQYLIKWEESMENSK